MKTTRIQRKREQSQHLDGTWGRLWEVESEVLDKVSCDICGEDKSCQRFSEHMWPGYDADMQESEVHISLTQREHYNYSGGYEKKEYWHVCPQCWREEIVPFIKSKMNHDITIQETHW